MKTDKTKCPRLLLFQTSHLLCWKLDSQNMIICGIPCWKGKILWEMSCRWNWFCICCSRLLFAKIIPLSLKRTFWRTFQTGFTLCSFVKEQTTRMPFKSRKTKAKYKDFNKVKLKVRKCTSASVPLDSYQVVWCLCFVLDPADAISVCESKRGDVGGTSVRFVKEDVDVWDFSVTNPLERQNNSSFSWRSRSLLFGFSTSSTSRL